MLVVQRAGNKKSPSHLDAQAPGNPLRAPVLKGVKIGSRGRPKKSGFMYKAQIRME